MSNVSENNDDGDYMDIGDSDSEEYSEEEMATVKDLSSVFGPFSRDIRPAAVDDKGNEVSMTKEDEIRQLLAGKVIFGPFPNYVEDIHEVSRKEQLQTLYATYQNMFPKCPALYLKDMALKTVDSQEAQSCFIIMMTGMGALPPTEWLATLRSEDLDKLEGDSLWVRQHQLQSYLTGTYPGISPDYWMEKIKILESEEMLYEFLLKTFFKPKMMKNWPTRESYEAMKRTLCLVEEYLSSFDPKEFSVMKTSGFDPVSHYGNCSRMVSKENKKIAAWFLTREYRFVPRFVINRALKQSNFAYYPAYKKLQEYNGRRRKTMRPDAPMPEGIELSLLKEVQFARNAQVYAHWEKNWDQERNEKAKEARVLGLMRTCQACFSEECLPEETAHCSNGHETCYDCLRQAADVAVGESVDELKCIGDSSAGVSCGEIFPLHLLSMVIQPKLFAIWLRKVQHSEAERAIQEGLASCPFCNYVAIYDQPPEKNRTFVCKNPECYKESCRLCNELSHIPLTCDQIEKSAQLRARIHLENRMTEALLRHCNKCKKPFFKTEGCNKMTCNCGNSQCYLCGVNVKHYEHFFSDKNNQAQGKCPLRSDNIKLMEEEVRKGALAGKAEISKQNPELKLFHDPSKDVLKKDEKKDEKE